MQDCEESLCVGLPYNTNRGNDIKNGRLSLIDEGSVEEGIIADWMEQGMGTRMTTRMVNEHCCSEGKEPVPVSVIIVRHFKKMKPMITKIKIKRPQGNNENEV